MGVFGVEEEEAKAILFLFFSSAPLTAFNFLLFICLWAEEVISLLRSI
jgi:hypothetical protein